MNASLPRRGRLAGIDHGSVRIGVAVTDAGQRLASPYENYARRGEEEDATHFRRLVEQEEIVGFVVGLPVHASGEESEQSHLARRFGRWLAETTGAPVAYFDERYTTAEAERMLSAASLTRKRRKKRLDMAAAQIILAAYLESTRREGPPEPLEDRAP